MYPLQLFRNFKSLTSLWIPGLLILLTMNLQAQIYPAKDGWMVGVQGGMVSFFGDLSVHDRNPVKKLSEESDFGFSFMVGKQLSRLISVKAGYLNGKMKGSNPELNSAFTSEFSEISFTTELNLTKLIVPSSNSRLNAVAVLGIGAIAGTVTKTLMTDGISDPSILPSETSDIKAEPVLITGLGLDYKLSRHWISAMRLGMRTTGIDNIDAHQGTADNNANDYYTYLSVGVIYVISPVNGLSYKDYPCSPWE